MHRARSAARRTYHQARGLLGGGGGLLGRLMPIGVGAAGQVAATVGNSFMSPWGGIAGLAGVGLVAKNETLMTLARDAPGRAGPPSGCHHVGNLGRAELVVI